MSNKIKVGDRIGAVHNANIDNVDVFGYGEYIGEDFPPYKVSGPLRRRKKTAKLRLDSGEIIWGLECWWGSEKEVKTFVKNKKEQKTVKTEDFRGRQPEFLLDNVLNAILQNDDDEDVSDHFKIIEIDKEYLDTLEVVEIGYKFECLDCGKDHVLRKDEHIISPNKDVAHDLLFYDCQDKLKVGSINKRFVAKSKHLNLPEIDRTT